MEYQVELLKVNKEGSDYTDSPDQIYVLALPRRNKANIGDLVIGLNGLTRISSIYEGDYFDSRIYFLEDGGRVVNPRKVLVTEEDLSPSLIQEIKDLEGPLFIKIKNSGEIEILR